MYCEKEELRRQRVLILAGGLDGTESRGIYRARASLGEPGVTQATLLLPEWQPRIMQTGQLGLDAGGCSQQRSDEQRPLRQERLDPGQR